MRKRPYSYAVFLIMPPRSSTHLLYLDAMNRKSMNIPHLLYLDAMNRKSINILSSPMVVGTIQVPPFLMASPT